MFLLVEIFTILLCEDNPIDFNWLQGDVSGFYEEYLRYSIQSKQEGPQKA